MTRFQHRLIPIQFPSLAHWFDSGAEYSIRGKKIDPGVQMKLPLKSKIVATSVKQLLGLRFTQELSLLESFSRYNRRFL